MINMELEETGLESNDAEKFIEFYIRKMWPAYEHVSCKIQEIPISCVRPFNNVFYKKRINYAMKLLDSYATGNRKGKTPYELILKTEKENLNSRNWITRITFPPIVEIRNNEYFVVDGANRIMAATLAKRTHVHCVVVDKCYIPFPKEPTDFNPDRIKEYIPSFQHVMGENIQKENLRPTGFFFSNALLFEDETKEKAITKARAYISRFRKSEIGLHIADDLKFCGQNSTHLHMIVRVVLSIKFEDEFFLILTNTSYMSEQFGTNIDKGFLTPPFYKKQETRKPNTQIASYIQKVSNENWFADSEEMAGDLLATFGLENITTELESFGDPRVFFRESLGSSDKVAYLAKSWHVNAAYQANDQVLIELADPIAHKGFFYIPLKKIVERGSLYFYGRRIAPEFEQFCTKHQHAIQESAITLELKHFHREYKALVGSFDLRHFGYRHEQQPDNDAAKSEIAQEAFRQKIITLCMRTLSSFENVFSFHRGDGFVFVLPLEAETKAHCLKVFFDAYQNLCLNLDKIFFRRIGEQTLGSRLSFAFGCVKVGRLAGPYSNKVDIDGKILIEVIRLDSCLSEFLKRNNADSISHSTIRHFMISQDEEIRKLLANENHGMWRDKFGGLQYDLTNFELKDNIIVKETEFRPNETSIWGFGTSI